MKTDAMTFVLNTKARMNQDLALSQVVKSESRSKILCHNIQNNIIFSSQNGNSSFTLGPLIYDSHFGTKPLTFSIIFVCKELTVFVT